MKTEQYLQVTENIDWSQDLVVKKAKSLSSGLSDSLNIAKACFEFVRDEIKHSNDYKSEVVTCKASDVLLHGTGFCYAKSHLLAALLRANGIPSGLCYQRLSNGDGTYCLHGLNAIYLPDIGWYRVDARGNKPGVLAEFSPPMECLAFDIANSGGIDLTGIYSEPLAEVVIALNRFETCEETSNNLPDIEVW